MDTQVKAEPPANNTNGPPHKKPNTGTGPTGNIGSGTGGPQRGGRGGGNRFGGRGGNQMRNNQNRGQQNQPKPLLQDVNIKGGNNNADNKDDDNRRGGGGPNRRGEEHMMLQKLKAMHGTTLELPPMDTAEIKFAGRNRLYIGNLTSDITDEELVELFKPYGETNEHFINKEKNFGFIRMDYHANAERAKRELDGSIRKGRPLRVRFAPNNTAVRVKNLTQWVSNELLLKAFEIFGAIERCVIIVDDRGKSTGEGIIEFSRKAGAMCCLRNCSEKCFFLTSSLRPVVVESYDHNDDIDGYMEKNLLRKNPEFFKARQVGPRFAEPGSFEHEYGTRWKQLHELFKQKNEALKREMLMEEEKLEAQMEYAKYEHETEMLREELRQREQDRDRQKREWEMKERQADEQRTRDEEMMRRQQEEMQVRMHHQEEELRRRQQENTLFMQAQQLNSMLDQQEQGMGGQNYDSPRDAANYDEQGGGHLHGDLPGYMEYDHGHGGRGGNRFDDMNNTSNKRGGGGGGVNRGNWGNDNRRGGEDYQNKRRRF